GSVRVAIVLDEVGPGEVDLYVDADRNRKIDERDHVTPSGASAGSANGSRRERIWRLPLDVAMVDGEVTHTVPRAVVFRLGASGRTLGYAAAGYLEGTVTLGGGSQGQAQSHARRLAARRVDGDRNGLMTHAQA